MKKLRRCLELFMVIAAMAVIAAAPGSALAAGEDPGGGSSLGETGTDSSETSTESAPSATSEEAPSTTTAPPSTGWVPQGEGEETSGQGASTRRGSSLGVAAGSKQVGSKSEEPAPREDSSAYESESSSPSTPSTPSTTSTFEGSTRKPRVTSPVGSVEPSATETIPAEKGHAAIGAAIQVDLPQSTPVANTSPTPPTAPVADTRIRATPNSDGLPLPILILCVLALLLAGGRLLVGPVEPDLFRSGPLQRVRRALTRV